MDLMSDNNDIYLNGQLQQFVIEANAVEGTVTLLQQDYCAIRSGLKHEACLIPSDSPDSYRGFATIRCRGKVRIVPMNQNTDESRVTWVTLPDGFTYRGRIIKPISLKTHLIEGTTLQFVCPHLPRSPFWLEDVDLANGNLHIKCTRTDGLLFYIFAELPSVTYVLEDSYQCGMTYMDNVKNKGVSIRLIPFAEEKSEDVKRVDLFIKNFCSPLSP